jgi:hypothetical protein
VETKRLRGHGSPSRVGESGLQLLMADSVERNVLKAAAREDAEVGDVVEEQLCGGGGRAYGAGTVVS